MSAFLLTAAPVAAHPLGNFTINHLTKISVVRDRIAVRYVLDMAEIPTFSTLRAASPNGSLSGPQLAAWGRSEAASLLPALRLASGETILIPLVLDRVATRTRAGAGGLPTLYFALDAHATLARPVSSLPIAMKRLRAGSAGTTWWSRRGPSRRKSSPCIRALSSALLDRRRPSL